MTLDKNRIINVTEVTERNDLIDAVKDGKIIIVAKGKLYNEMVNEAKNSKSNDAIGSAGIVTAILGVLSLNPVMAGVGIVTTVFGKVTDNFMNYRIDIQKTEERIVFIKKNGKDKYKRDTDTIIGL